MNDGWHRSRNYPYEESNAVVTPLLQIENK
jgi:hypothetical protein